MIYYYYYLNHLYNNCIKITQFWYDVIHWILHKHVKLASKDLPWFPHTWKWETFLEQGAAAEQAIAEHVPWDGRAPKPATPACQYAERMGPG